MLTDSEKTYTIFADACVASGTAGCKLVELVGDHATGQDIRQLLDDAHDVCLPFNDKTCASNISPFPDRIGVGTSWIQSAPYFDY